MIVFYFPQATLASELSDVCFFFCFCPGYAGVRAECLRGGAGLRHQGIGEEAFGAAAPTATPTSAQERARPRAGPRPG